MDFDEIFGDGAWPKNSRLDLGGGKVPIPYFAPHFHPAMHFQWDSNYSLLQFIRQVAVLVSTRYADCSHLLAS